MNRKIFKSIIILFAIWAGGIIISLLLNIKNGLLPSLFLAAATSIWFYKSK